MARVIRLTESELKNLIGKIIEEQSLTSSQNIQEFGLGGIAQSYQQGKQQAMNTTGAAAGKAVHTAAVAAFQGAKQVVITIGKVAIKAVIYGAATIFVIGELLYKATAAIANAIFKFLSATGKVVVSTATAVGDDVASAFKKAGVAIEQGAQAVANFVGKMKDSSIAMVKYMIGQLKQFGNMVWAKVLVGASAVKEFGGAVTEWCKQQYQAVAQAVGVAWDQAVGALQKGYDAFKQGVANTANKIATTASNAYQGAKQGVTNFANNAANAVGKGVQNVKDFFGNLFEMLMAYESMDGMNTNEILSEMYRNNGKQILI